MNIVEKYISPLIKSQFPDFYKEQGPLFILFVEEYYRWLENNTPNYSNYPDNVVDGNPTYHIRRLFEYRDIDQTLDKFLIYFKEKYLKGVQADTNISQRKLIKAAQDIFSSKGSERSIDLLFKLVYGTKIEIFTPGDYILKPSDGTWVVPTYLELSQSSKNASFPGKQIRGSISNATAFVEYVITRNINGKLIDIAFLNNLTGNFQTGESILDDDIIDNAPIVVGSLSSVDITSAGELFQVGETVKLFSARGVEGLARVTDIDAVTGIVRFFVIDGGWGFSINAETEVSEKVLSISNITNSNSSITDFARFETVTQNTFNFSLTNVTGTLSTYANVNNGNTSTPSLSLSVNVTQNTSIKNTANIILNQITGDIFSNNIIFEKNKALVYVTGNSILFNNGDQVVQSSSGSNNTFGFVSNSSNVIIIEVDTSSIGANGLHVGTYLRQQTTNAAGYIAAIPRENYFTFTNVSHIAISDANGSFSNSNVINVYSNSSMSTQLGTFSVATSSNGIFSGAQYELVDTNLTTNTRWSSSNTILKVGAPSVNAIITLASDVGGLISSYNDISPTGNVIGTNTSSIGIINVANTFYGNGTIIYGISSNTYATIGTIYSGQGATFSVGVIENSEIVRVSPDLISSNNDGPGSNSVKFSDMLISGANSTFGNVSSVFIDLPGAGYDNTNVVVFTGGNTGVGSYEVGNASIITDNAGAISTVTLSANVGNGIITTPVASIVNSTGGSTGVGTGASLIPVSSLGFIKLPLGDINFRILDLLRFNTLTIGTISSLTGINPGEQYTSNPFALVYEPDIASYGKKDIILNVNLLTGTGFSEGETIEQTLGTPSIQIIANNYSGNTSNNFEVNEFVYATDGVSNTGNGTIFSTSFDALSNSYTIVLVGNTGTFSPGDQLIGLTTNSTVDIISTSAYTASSLARGIIKTNSNNQSLSVKRISLFTEFAVGNTIIGKTTGASANVVGVAVDPNSKIAGDNANVIASVIASNGAIQNIEIINSGFGYEQDETITISSIDGERLATGKSNIIKQGIGEGYFSSSRGFLDDSMYLIDGEYYQAYSYEIRTSIPLEKYSELLKNVLHIAGKKYFGKVLTQPIANVNMSITTSVEIT